MGHETHSHQVCLPHPVPFGSSAIDQATYACCNSRSLSPIHICSPYRLASTYPACGCQEGLSLTLDTPHLGASFHCHRRSLFRQLASPGDTGGPLRFRGTTSRHNLVSQGDVLRIVLDHSCGTVKLTTKRKKCGWEVGDIGRPDARIARQRSGNPSRHGHCSADVGNLWTRFR